MRVAEKTAGRLVLQEKPWLVLLVGGLFIVSAGVMAVMTGERLGGAGFALLGAVLILAFGNTVTVTFDTNVNRFTRRVRGPVRNSEITHRLSEVAGASVEASRASRGSPAYRVALVLASGARLPLTTSYSSGKAAKEEDAATIRAFLNLKQGPEIQIPGFIDMLNLTVDPNAAQRLGEMFGGPVAEYQELVRREPDKLEARKQLGLALAMQNKPHEAREHFEAAREIASRHGNQALAAEIDDTLKRMNDAASRR